MVNEPMGPGTKEAAVAPTRKGGSKILWILLPMLLLLGVGAFWGWSYIKGDDEQGVNGKPDQNLAPPPIVAFSPFVVNLVDEGDLPRYLKIEFDMELRRGSDTEEVRTKLGELRDAVIVLLTSKRSSDLISIEGKDRLRDEIITRLNGRLQYATVNKIFFKEFIIQ